jgi:hypothetical protein
MHMIADTNGPARRHGVRLAVVAAALAAVVGAIAWWSARDAAPVPAPSAAAPVDLQARAPAAVPSSGPAQAAPAAPAGSGAPAGVAQGRAPRVVRGPASAGRDAFERARNLGALFNALHAQADPDALFFAQRALRECMPYVLANGTAGQPPALDRYRPALPDDPMTPRRAAAYSALQDRCSGFDLGADPFATARALREALAATSDPRAALEQAAMAVRRGGAPGEIMDKVRAIAGDGDPYALEQASGVMSALRGRYVFVLDGQVVKPDIVAAGWMMAACDAGRSCGDEWVQAPCAFLTECDARDLESSLQRYQLTPSEYEAMQQVRARITRGVTTGQWDASLFAPQAAPPGYRRWGP